MIKFRLSDETKMLLKKDTKIPSLPKKRADITVGREFYDKHSDLAPRNIYLYLGRVTTREDIDREFERITKEPFLKRVKNFINKIIKKEK